MARILLRMSLFLNGLLKTTAKSALALFFLLFAPVLELSAATSDGNPGRNHITNTQTTVQRQEAPNHHPQTSDGQLQTSDGQPQSPTGQPQPSDRQPQSPTGQPQTQNQPQIPNKQLQTSNDLSTNSEILRQFTAKLKSYPAFEMKFSMVVDVSEFEGVVQSQGESFRLTNSQLELYCNGTTKWVYNIDNKELTIMPNDLSQTDLTENPMAFLTSLEKGYSYSEKPRETTESGKVAWIIELKTVNKKLPYTSITLVVEKSTLKPLAVEYLAKNGTRHVARIPYFMGKRPWPAGYFSFPESRVNGLSVTDLR